MSTEADQAGVRAGASVQRPGTGERGTVLSLNRRGFARVQFSNEVLTVHESELVPDNADAQDRWEELREGGRAYPFSLRLQARYLKHAFRYDPIAGLSNARIEPKPHQVAVAYRVLKKVQPRMILADEVGLGKTIEAGLILKELRARRLIDKVLVVCPASLQSQWQSELASKFNERFEVMDAVAAKHYGRHGDNPFTATPNVITSLAFASREERREQIQAEAWDLVIFDEAHRVRMSRHRRTRAYELAEGLRDHVEGLLLLTATPMQLDLDEFLALVDLVEPGLYVDAQQFRARQSGVRTLNELFRDLGDWQALREEQRADVLQRHRALLGELGTLAEVETRLDDPPERDRLLDELAYKHPLAQVMVRNRKREVGIWSQRSALRRPVTLGPEERSAYDAVTEYLRDGYNRALQREQRAVGFLMVTYHKMLASSTRAIRVSLQRRAEKLKKHRAVLRELRQDQLADERLEEIRDSEDLAPALDDVELAAIDPVGLDREIAQLEDLVAQLGTVGDPKAEQLIEELRALLEHDEEDKVIVFTHYRETQAFLQQLLAHHGYAVEVFHGGMTREEKEFAVRRFREEAQVLVSTESGGEGRNFQFCRVLINFDLPWNPMRVEQRIGRVDRIGQTRTVLVRNLYCEDTIEERVVEVLENRIRVFTEAIGALDPILGDVEHNLERVAMDPDPDRAFRELSEDLDRKIAQAKEAQRRFDEDFALDRLSFRTDEAQRLIEQGALADWHHLQAYVADVLRYYGGTLAIDGQGLATINLAPELKAQLRWRHAVEQGAFDPEVARLKEEVPFFAFGHPLIDALIQLPLERQEPEVAAVASVEDGARGPYVVVWHRVRAEGIRAEAEFRRHRIDERLEVESIAQCEPPAMAGVDRPTTAPEWLDHALAASEQQAETELQTVRKRLLAEHERLKAEKRDREERIFGDRRRRLQAKLDADQGQIEELAEHGDESAKRILPALRGRIRKTRNQLEELEAERTERLAEVDAQTVTADAEQIAVAFVEGS